MWLSARSLSNVCVTLQLKITFQVTKRSSAYVAEPVKPAFIKPIKDLKVIIGQPINLEAQIVGFPSPEVKWFKDGAPLRPSKTFNFVNQPNGVIGLK